ncbi:MAG: hypothetical protein ACPGJV_00815 [Bacteriovoracaceae bacterium]
MSFSQSFAAKFDLAKANAELQNYIETYKESHLEHYAKDFEIHLTRLQNLYKERRTFLEQTLNELKKVEINRRADVSKVLSNLRKLTKDFEKAQKRRLKFFQKDVLKPVEKKFKEQHRHDMGQFRKNAY